MGPAALLKALGGRYFSLTVFGFTQVAIDLESLIYMARASGRYIDFFIVPSGPRSSGLLDPSSVGLFASICSGYGTVGSVRNNTIGFTYQQKSPPSRL